MTQEMISTILFFFFFSPAALFTPFSYKHLHLPPTFPGADWPVAVC